ncbi:MAG TPA: GAF domain-containing sensor histidine kinase [Planctomycetota bacterium]|nr:GAF domain-containing sensor histidine kinase [Planctomycetota bacterium]
MSPQRDEELLLLQSIALELSHCGSLEKALEIVIRKFCGATGWALGEAWLPRVGRRVLIRGPVWHAPSPRMTTFLKETESCCFPRGRGLPGRVWKSRKPLWIRDVRVDSNFPRAAVARNAGLKAGFAIPVLAGRRIVAVLNFFVLERRSTDEHLLRLVSAVAAQLGSIIRRNLVEEALRVSRHTVAVQEAERRRLARELHDGVKQSLSAVRFRLRAMEEGGRADPAGVSQAGELLDSALQDLGRVCRNLGSSLVQDLGLEAAVRRLCRDFEERTRTPVEIERARFPHALPPELGSSLYRMVQEGLANVERHAKARQVWLRLWRRGLQLGLILRDDGVGFDPARLHPAGTGPTGYGLGNLRERVEALGGRVGILSAPGTGTRLEIRVPWRKR